ncbi:MAG: GNAT family N-acetyltransferase [Iamia sp.]
MHPPPPDQVDLGEVLLRAPSPEDAEALFTATSRDLGHLGPWMAWATPEANTLEARAAFIDECRAKTTAGQEAHYLVVDPADGRVLGACGLHDRISDEGIEIGYWLASAAIGHGLMTRILATLTDVALACEDITRVEVHCNAANAPSNGVPRRLGFTLERVEDTEVTAPAESGRTQIWVRTDPVGLEPG